MQRVAGEVDGRLAVLDLPLPEAEVVPGVSWGRFDHPLTPAFWAAQTWMSDLPTGPRFRLGETLAEEVVACLLGGHGAPAEVGLAAYTRVRDALRSRGDGTLPLDVAQRLLSEPLDVGDRRVRYRFARTRAGYLSACLDGLRGVDEASHGDVALRDVLTKLPGIGPKTASWVVRNRRASDAVAILDVHIVRACQVMGVFAVGAAPARGYRELERRYLDLCLGLGCRASVLDAVMWATMRKLSVPLYNLIVDAPGRFADKPSPRTKGRNLCQARTTPAAISAARGARPT
ncbi:endonuclease III domain-containing protein [Methylobacterium sp. NPDC080182]|uniref:8-oxoguanine DNA glycosylase n=1 Tax=Methylobacterium sp. NPDC080182 TaxID=3390590 RepID=UPI003D070849